MEFQIGNSGAKFPIWVSRNAPVLEVKRVLIPRRPRSREPSGQERARCKTALARVFRHWQGQLVCIVGVGTVFPVPGRFSGCTLKNDVMFEKVVDLRCGDQVRRASYVKHQSKRTKYVYIFILAWRSHRKIVIGVIKGS